MDKTPESIPLYQRVLSALIVEDDVNTPEEGDARNMQFLNPCVSTYDDTYNLNNSSYEDTSLVDKLLLELNSIGLCPDMMVGPMFVVYPDFIKLFFYGDVSRTLFNCWCFVSL